MRRVALDANLLVLLVVGSVKRSLIGTHRRLQEYLPEDFPLLIEHLGERDLVTIPNALTEASNLLPSSVAEPDRSELMAALANFADQAAETYVPSARACSDANYLRLGLTDVAWLAMLDRETELLTADLALYRAALDRGLVATNFNHLRDPRPEM